MNGKKNVSAWIMFFFSFSRLFPPSLRSRSFLAWSKMCFSSSPSAEWYATTETASEGSTACDCDWVAVCFAFFFCCSDFWSEGGGASLFLESREDFLPAVSPSVCSPEGSAFPFVAPFVFVPFPFSSPPCCCTRFPSFPFFFFFFPPSSGCAVAPPFALSCCACFCSPLGTCRQLSLQVQLKLFPIMYITSALCFLSYGNGTPPHFS
mmetsp:Transcript_16511/g.33627  ORF Transcript_16511/g.33627 Transcript_16511/m.33627 type:complete len:207 (-) Transcript_16511:312-932(-)